jgi:hypothetical protein
LSEDEAKARADKAAGCGMVTRVAVAGGIEDWQQETNAHTKMGLQSLDGILKL